MKIAIAGAGIGGLAAAILLRQRGVEVTVFDQFSAPEPVGSGLVIQPVGQAVLGACGVLDQVVATGNRVTRMLGHEADNGRRVLDVWYDRRKGNNFGLALHRNALFSALWDKATAEGATMRLKAKVIGAGDGCLDLEGGEKAAGFDLVIDALGARSPVTPIRSVQLSYGALWANVAWPDGTELPLDHLRQSYRKASNMVGVLPIGVPPGATGPMAAIFWSLPRDGYAAWRAAGLDAWKEQASALWPAFAAFADQITDPDQLTMARYAHGTLRVPYRPGVVHIGDSAHRASPQLGQGANMALLDAYALARAIEAHGPKAALPAYAKARRWHVRAYQTMSWAFTPQYQSDSRWLPVLRDRVLFPVSMIPPVPRILSHLVCGTLLPAFPKGDPLR
ncbi:glutamate synthase [Tateyamaria omphalii]|uniref:FAD-dependent oxidoreductase n=1 Tax=Tateyamaria omphalii TaxID=299262 RepID=UPI0016799F16|nr:NAD(P)/FAD-dependent oxidoreductase [Tateyamaria omphalii]GGX49627.1 glutamate synthase [Tateyamaria omphalii]